MRVQLLPAAGLILAIALGACGACEERSGGTRSTASATAGPGSGASPRRPDPFAAGSTIAARDYIGPDACGECHAEQLAMWSTSLHRVMNQRAQAGTDAVIGDFDHAVVPYAGGEAHFDRVGADYVMTLASQAHTVRYRVTRTIGRRGLQEYVGVELSHGRPAATDADAVEVRLPFGWWPRRHGWYPQPYFDPWLAEDKVDVYAPVREPWAQRCPWCHSTYPFEQRVARAAARPIGHGFEQHFVSAPGSDRLAVEQQVTVGISCESCHLGGRAHAAGAPIHFVPQGAEPRPGAPVPTTFTEERRDPSIVNTVCAQCHSGPSPRLPDGSALRNSSEALDLAASPCTTARCIDCHDPHLGGADEKRAILACTTCHPALADADAARLHGGHTTATCLDCHMPKIVMGVDRFVRTHRIGSPTDPAMFAAGAPNACNLCHLDRSIAWTLDELERGYEVHVDPRRLASRDLDASVGELWLASAEPAIRLIATAAYARSSLPDLAAQALPILIEGLADARAHVRTWTVFAVEQALGRPLPVEDFDPRAPLAIRQRQLARLRTQLHQLGARTYP